MELQDLWRTYADTGPGPEAPLYRALANTVADDPELLAVAAAAPAAAHHPNHMLAAVRFLLLDETEHALAEAYAVGDRDAAVREFRTFVLDHREQILDVLATRRVQTNEVGRIAAIAAALAHVAHRTSRPLGLLDVGASAGLNLLVDRCRVDYGDFSVGPEDAQLRVSARVSGSLARFDVDDLRLDWRLGLDRSPIDLDDEASARWLEACVWIDHPERIARLRLAVELARRHPSTIAAGDAVDALAGAMAQAPADLHLVVLTTWVAFYLSKEQRRAFEGVLADASRPVSWVSLEHPGVVDVPRPPVPPEHEVVPSVLGLVDFDGVGGVERRFLGWAHSHGRWIDWRADELVSGPGERRPTPARGR